MHQLLRTGLAVGAAAALAGLAAATSEAAPAEPLQLSVDQATVLRVPQAADTVIIGNPSIADATIRDARTLIITGRNYGTTNLIVLGADGQEITQKLLSVSIADDHTVTVFSKFDRRTYSCLPTCEPTLTVGDSQELFSIRKDQMESHSSMATTGSGQQSP